MSYNRFLETSRAFIIREIAAIGTRACILGCTEIELLVQQEHMTALTGTVDGDKEVVLLPSAQIHIEAISGVLLGERQLTDFMPHNIQHSARIKMLN